MKSFTGLLLLASIVIVLLFQSCEDGVNNSPVGSGKPSSAIIVSPSTAALGLAGQQLFTAALNGDSSQEFVWSVAAGPGQISASGEYTAPAQLSLYSMSTTIKAMLASDTSKVGYAQIIITGLNTGNSASGDSTGNGGGTDTTATPKDTTVCYERDILPILRSNCAMSGCHDSYTREEGIDLTSYQSTINSGGLVIAHNPAKSELYEVITQSRVSKRMPPSPRAALTSDQIALIRRWILEGATNRDCSKDTVSTGCDLSNVTFSNTVQPILQNNCTGCHSGSAPSGGVLLTSYANVKKVADDGRLVGVVSHASGFKSMPPGGTLQSCFVEQIKVWVQAGAPNN